MLPFAPDAVDQLAVGLGRRAVGARGLRSGHAVGVDLERGWSIMGPSAREGCPLCLVALQERGGRLWLPVSYRSGFLVVRRPSLFATFSSGSRVGGAEAASQALQRCERRRAAGAAFARWVLACVAEACARTDPYQRPSSRGSPLGGAKMTLSLRYRHEHT